MRLTANAAKRSVEARDREEKKAAPSAAAQAKAKSDRTPCSRARPARADQGRSGDAVDLNKQAYGVGSGRATGKVGDIYGRGSGDVGRDYSEKLQWYEKAKAAGVDVPTPGKRKY